MKKGKRLLLSSAVILSLLSQASVPVAQVLATETPPASSVTLNQDQLNQYLTDEAKKEILTPLRQGDKIHAEIKDGNLIIKFDDSYEVVPGEEIPIYFVQFDENNINIITPVMVVSSDLVIDNKVVGKISNGSVMYKSSSDDFTTIEEFQKLSADKLLDLLYKKTQRNSEIVRSNIVLNENASKMKNRQIIVPIVRYENMEKSRSSISLYDYFLIW